MKYYLTTPLYYVNAAPHIGHAYTSIAGDAIKRLRRLQGFEPILMMGTDEHGQKVERSAEAAGKTPVAFTDSIYNEFRSQWDALGIDYDRFMRTTNPVHHKTVQWLFQRCMDNGYVYKGSYTGQYCVYDELYVNDAKPGDPCPDCGRPTETVTEENYFFKLSAFTERLLKFYEDNPDFILPESRRNEVLSFVRQGLNDLSISRSNLKWGIPLPVEGHHVFYVWFDALIGYVSAVWGEDRWPADLHLIGKEIVRFHAIFWPAFLMAGDLPVTKRVFAHGWLLFEQDKMSKSRGNIVRAEPIRRVMGTDGLRYFLLREIVFGQDGSFSYDALLNRYNSDLANGIGNLASRVLAMIRQYRSGVIPAQAGACSLEAAAADCVRDAAALYDKFEFSRALESVWGLIGAADKFIVENAPWKLAKAPGDDARAQLDTVLYAAAETLRITTALASPVIPDAAARIWAQLQMPAPLNEVRFESLHWGGLAAGQTIGEAAAVFPRLDAAQATAQMRELEQEIAAQQAELLGKTPQAEPAEERPPLAPIAPEITIDDFIKVDLRVGKVLSAEPVKGADKLLHLKVDIGESEPRTIVAGIAAAYKPEALVGRKVAIVANLAPRKLRGLTSQGMIVAASLEGGSPALVSFLEEVPIGARLK